MYFVDLVLKVAGGTSLNTLSEQTISFIYILHYMQHLADELQLQKTQF